MHKAMGGWDGMGGGREHSSGFLEANACFAMGLLLLENWGGGLRVTAATLTPSCSAPA